MNPDVKGDSYKKNPVEFLDTEMDIIKTYSLIIVDQLSFVKRFYF